MVGVAVGGVALLLGWGTVLGRPWTPDGGLRQLDLLALDEASPVPLPVDRPSLVVASAPGACARQVRRGVDRYGRDDGLPRDAGLLVLDAGAPAADGLSAGSGPGAEPGGVRRVPDPGAVVARALGLRGDGPCVPGYVLVVPVATSPGGHGAPDGPDGPDGRTTGGDPTAEVGSARLRYRTLDPDWARHGDEQRVLLGWLDRG